MSLYFPYTRFFFVLFVDYAFLLRSGSDLDRFNIPIKVSLTRRLFESGSRTLRDRSRVVPRSEGKVSIERSEFLCSFAGLEKFSRELRGHWGIENEQHWILDIHFEEDKNRTRADHAPENLALMQKWP